MAYQTRKQQIASMKAAQAIRNYRVSTEEGDTYLIQASSIEAAQNLARESHEGTRFTVYEDKR